MKKIYILTLCLLTLGFKFYGQDLEAQKFNQMTLNNMSMDDLFGPRTNWTSFKSIMGAPLSESSRSVDGEYNEKKFLYNGAEFRFSDYLRPFDLRKATITTSAYIFTYDGVQIKVGNQLNTLSQKFSDEYVNRRNGRMIIKHEFADIVLRVFYNSSNVISKIELAQYLL